MVFNHSLFRLVGLHLALVKVSVDGLLLDASMAGIYRIYIDAETAGRREPERKWQTEEQRFLFVRGVSEG